MNTIQQITCGICFGNKKEIYKFPCGCSLVICLGSYINGEKKKSFSLFVEI